MTRPKLAATYKDHLLPTGIPEIDQELGGLEPGSLVAVVGTPQDGGPELLFALVRAWARSTRVAYAPFALGRVTAEQDLRQRRLDDRVRLFHAAQPLHEVKARFEEWSSGSAMQALALDDVGAMGRSSRRTTADLKTYARERSLVVALGYPSLSGAAPDLLPGNLGVEDGDHPDLILAVVARPDEPLFQSALVRMIKARPAATSVYRIGWPPRS